jgi:hypothetical protein
VTSGDASALVAVTTERCGQICPDGLIRCTRSRHAKRIVCRRDVCAGVPTSRSVGRVPGIHASISSPDDLLRRYDAMVAEVPAANMGLHPCVRARDGIVLIDTCPSRAVFEAFAGDRLRALRERRGLPEPAELDDFPVHVAFVNGVTV